MLGEDVRAGGKIGDGANELDDAGAGACGQAHIVDNLFKQDLAFLAQRAVFLYELVVHRGVAENTFFCKSSFLDFTSRLHSRRDSSTRFSLLPVHQFLRIYLPQKQLHIDSDGG